MTGEIRFIHDEGRTRYGPMEQFTSEQKKDLRILVSFVRVYCAARHQGQAEVTLPGELAGTFSKGVSLCPDCLALLDYALGLTPDVR